MIIFSILFSAVTSKQRRFAVNKITEIRTSKTEEPRKREKEMKTKPGKGKKMKVDRGIKVRERKAPDLH